MNVSRFCYVALIMLFSVAALAQSEDNGAAIRKEHWNIGVLAGGGTGLIDRTDVQFVRAGVRMGRVMTGELGSGPLRGTFEVDSEIMPLDYVLWGGYKDVYSFGVNPLVMKWNFTNSKKAFPYFVVQGGMLWSANNVPPGNTSRINFVTGFGLGMNYFVKARRSLNWDVRATHLSNASLGTHNPGVNASLQVSVGYNWWKK